MRKLLILTILFGLVYLNCEVAFSAIKSLAWSLKGDTSLWMAPVGGACGLILSFLHRRIKYGASYRLSVLLGALSITLVEFTSGCILNLWLGFDIWSYKGLPLNILGQICLPFTLLWYVFTPSVFWIGDVIEFYLYDTKHPIAWYKYYTRIFTT